MQTASITSFTPWGGLCIARTYGVYQTHTHTHTHLLVSWTDQNIVVFWTDVNRKYDVCTSTTSFFFSDFRLSRAASKAGSASSRSFWASAAMACATRAFSVALASSACTATRVSSATTVSSYKHTQQKYKCGILFIHVCIPKCCIFAVLFTFIFSMVITVSLAASSSWGLIISNSSCILLTSSAVLSNYTHNHNTRL